MTQYLIIEIQDSTGYIHRHFTKVKENEHMCIVEAESKDEAERKYNEKSEFKKSQK
ncbi:DUF1381 domain-containing protein [Staphylococcus epidermidis]|uniref:DUF1381 domain-containing protein n=1 Tax=Staphylococcus epidermidis TaxID=1282 RepID=UPI0036D3FF35